MSDLFDVELEKNVLSMMFKLAADQLSGVVIEISPEDFEDRINKVVYLSMQEVINKGAAMDPAVVDIIAKSQNRELPENYVWDLYDTSSVINIENKTHIFEILKRYSLLRKLNQASDNIKTITVEDTYEKIIEKADNHLASAISVETRGLVEKIGSSNFHERIKELVEHPVEIYGVQTGMSFFDECFDGIVPGLLTLIGGRPGTGKSALAQNIYYNVACKTQIPILVFDTETNLHFVENRLLAISSGVSFNDILHGRVSYEDLEPHIELIQNSPLYYYYMPQYNTNKVNAICKKYRKTFGIECFVVDFLGAAESDNSSAELGKKIKETHDIAVTQDLGCIVFQQLSRQQLDQTTGKNVKEVELGHFVLSDQTTWFADSIAGLRLPTTVEKQKYQCSHVIDVPKNRFGKIGDKYYLSFGGGNMRFENVVTF
jgi:replicative DNA helicase